MSETQAAVELAAPKVGVLDDLPAQNDPSTGVAKATAVDGPKNLQHQVANILGLGGGIGDLKRFQDQQGIQIPVKAGATPEIGESNEAATKASTLNGNASRQEHHQQQQTDILGLVRIDNGDPNLAQLFHVCNEAAVMSSATTYVNAKQYERIMHRRETRAILEAHYEQLERGKQRNNKYRHESRHLHSRKRLRNSKGTFLTKEEQLDYYKQNPEKAPKDVVTEAKRENIKKPT